MNTSAAIEGSSSKGHGEGVLWLELLPHENHFYSPPTAMTAYQLLIYIHPLFEALFKTMLCIPFIFTEHCQVIYRFFIRRVLSQTTRTLSKQDYLWCRHAYFNPLLSVFFFIHPPSNENLWQWDFAGKTWHRENFDTVARPPQASFRQIRFGQGKCCFVMDRATEWNSVEFLHVRCHVPWKSSPGRIHYSRALFI